LASGSSNDVHAMLIDVPSEITIKTSQPRRMAEILLEHDAGHALELTSDRVTIATLHTGRLFQEMPGWLAETGIEVDEMHSPDESMQSLFNSLMKIHRGEIS
jgi:ABC-2 type transport system ATP-binding protein